MSQLTNQVALITGGTTGIGLATAKLFAEHGARVVVTGQNPDTLAAAQRELGDRAVTIRADARIVADADRVASEIQRRFGRLDVVFLNAGIARFAPLEANDEAFFDDQFDTNVKGALFQVRAALPLLRDGASIIFNTSVVSVKGIANAAVYSATKGAVSALVRSLSAELAPRKIRVNAVSPGPIETPIYGKMGFPAEALDGFRGSMTNQVPLKRFGTGDEVAQAALFLASAASSYLTGVDLPVDGGLSVT